MNPNSPTVSRIPFPWQKIVTAVWLITMPLLILLFVIGLVIGLGQLETVCTGGTCHPAQLNPAEAEINQQLGYSLVYYAWYTTIAYAIFGLVFIIVGVLIFWRRSDDWMAVLVSTFLITVGIAAIPVLPIRPLAAVIFYIGGGFLVPLFLLFPNGRFAPRWMVWVFLASILFVNIEAIRNPISEQGISSGPPSLPSQLFFLIGVGSQIYRYWRVSTPLERQQTKWVVIGFSGWFACLAILLLARALFPELTQPGLPQFVFDKYRFAFVGLFPLTFIPLSFGLSILRYRLWDIDIVINRSLVYGTLTLFLAALFGVSLFIINVLFTNLTGAPLVAVVISAALFGALFQPARKALQRFVDRRFYNIQIDYNKTPIPPISGFTNVIKSTNLGEYRNLELIGRGGMSEIYRSNHPTLDVPVAIKILSAQLAEDPEFSKRFTREARISSELQHQNIVRVFDYGQVDGIHYMVMEHISGMDLANYLAQRGRLLFAEAIALLKPIASALDYAHAQGVVHRDIKPSNVLLETASTNPIPKLTDFGIAKIMNNSTRYTLTGGILGTFDYIAPEQIQATGNVDRRADIYAFGVMTYQLLTGQLPFQHANVGAILIAHLNQPPPDPRLLVPDLSMETSSTLERAMAKKTEERFNSVGEFVSALV